MSASLALVAIMAVPAFRDDPRLALLAWAFAAAAGLNPRWYFQGVERLPAAAWLTVAGQVVYAGLIVALVHAPADGWKVLLAQAVAAAATTTLLLLLMLRETGRHRLSLRPGLTMLRRGRQLFVSHAATSLYTSANVFLLGLLALPQQVAHYSAAERAVRAAAQVLSPVSDAVYPRMSHLLGRGELAPRAHASPASPARPSSRSGSLRAAPSTSPRRRSSRGSWDPGSSRRSGWSASWP